MTEETFRYDLAAMNDPRVILIENEYGRRSAVPRLGYVVLPQPCKPVPYRMPPLTERS